MNAKNEVVMLCFARYSNKFYRCKFFIFSPMYLWNKLFAAALGVGMGYVCG